MNQVSLPQKDNQFLIHFRSRWVAALQLLCTFFWTLQPLPVVNSYQHDSNGDGDPEEHDNPTDPNDNWWAIDSDGDQLTNAEEVTFGSDPYSIDSDGDGLTDRDERDLSQTNPWQWDSNNNGFSDHDEFYQCYTVNYIDLIAQMFWFSSYYDADNDGAHNQDDSDPINASLWDDWNRNGVSDATDASNEYSMHDNDLDGYQNGSDSHPDDSSLWNDWNNNGVNDDQENYTYDSDGDGYDDSYDSHPWDSSLWDQWDLDGDGVPDSFDSHVGDNLLWNDWNYNGVNDDQETNT
ncbi:hypothetical protein FEM03_03970 [Phragmitibacter flavus]|uniref:Uncharacterized protein n=1 Tax=Phragmitibacter flavus TaxID=2576071 RepID=A0A5R8KHY3_9BACT|nr:hypothetical protein [Phragmitibacter flavus]TLD71892.1 hypothetical protein FEM03_03970 [Phragmitibacter flavus]